MKKSLLIAGVAAALFSCNNNQPSASSTEFKTAYVDSEKLSKEYEAFKDLEAQSKVKQEELGRELDTKVERYKQDRAAAENQVQAKGPQWAQLKAQEFQRTEQEIQIMQQTMVKQLQEEFGAKNDSAVKKMKNYIKDYGKKNGYDYIYSSGEVASILYAKDGYDITDKILKELNDKYKGSDKTETPAKTEDTKTEKK